MRNLKVPPMIYLAILDRLGDGWRYGKLHDEYAYRHFAHTLELTEGIGWVTSQLCT